MSDRRSESTESTDRYLLLGHRVQRRGGYNANRWSASFEEGFIPYEFQDKKTRRVFHADNDPEETTIRGLREEFLGEEFNGKILISLQAVYIDLISLNLQLMAIVSLENTSFSEVKELWSSRKPIDYGEHNVLASIKLEQTTLEKALIANCPKGLVEEISNPGLEEYLKHPWHPRSQARIACCLWMLEEGLL